MFCDTGRTSSLNSLKLTVVSIILGLVALCLLLVTLILGVVICKQRSKQKYPLKLGLQEREQNPTLQVLVSGTMHVHACSHKPA